MILLEPVLLLALAHIFSKELLLAITLLEPSKKATQLIGLYLERKFKFLAFTIITRILYHKASEDYQKVYIPELDTYGIISQMCLTVMGIEYEVRYFHNGELKKVFFIEHELKESK